MNKKAAAVWFGAAALSFALWLAVGSSDELSIDLETCQPQGFVAETRRWLHPDQFRADQVRAIDLQLERTQQSITALYTPLPNEVQQAVSDSKKIAQGVMDDLYSKNPQLKPSPQELEAKRLRELADELQKQGQTERNARLLVRYAMQLAHCRSLYTL